MPTAMRSASHLRLRWLERLPPMITRAGMWSIGSGSPLNVELGMLLDDLCLRMVMTRNEPALTWCARSHGKLGVVGPFVAMFGTNGRYLAEVGSLSA